MSRGFKINRQSDLTERDSNLAPWLKQFAGRQKEPQTIVEKTRLRDSESLVSQINGIMGSKSRYATVSDAVNDMKERTGLDKYLNQLTANDKQTIKTAQALLEDLNKDEEIDDFEYYMKETDFDINNSYFELGVSDGEEDAANDMVGDLLSSIRLRNISQHLTNFMNFGLGYVIGAKMSKEDGNSELKKVYEFIKGVKTASVKKKVNKLAGESYPGEECEGGSCDAGQDNFNKFMSTFDFNPSGEYGDCYRLGHEIGVDDKNNDQAGDILASITALSSPIPQNLKSYISFGLGYCHGADFSNGHGKQELKRIFNYIHFKTKTAQLNVPTGPKNQLPESLAKYNNISDDIVNFIRNNIRNTNALGASVPAIQHDLLAVFGVKHGIEAQDVMNDDVAKFINNIIVSEMSMLGPEEHNPNIGMGIGKDMDMSDNNDAFKGLMPAK